MKPIDRVPAARGKVLSLKKKDGKKRPIRRHASMDLFESVLIQSLREAGKILLRYHGRIRAPRRKEDQSSVVCEADLASERLLIREFGSRFPEHSIISEERGRIGGSSEYTWVIDPLDGTSNFVAGIPWFGVQAALLRGASAVLAGMYLPVEDTLYFAQAGKGAFRNSQRVRVSGERNLENVLCAFGFDPVPDRSRRPGIELLFRVSGAVRNTRTTNSLVDFCYTIDGRLGGCINLRTMLWDIAPVSLILPEAGGRFTDLQGKQIQFQLDEGAAAREYAVLGASRVLHPVLADLTRGGAVGSG
jgi:myo-inositol-1(or 4)-monophosphatase